MADDVKRDAEPEIMRVQSLELRDDHADVLASLRHLHAADALQSQCVAERMRMRADAADALYEDHGLDEVHVLRQLLDAAVVVSDEYLRVRDLLTVCDETGMDRLLQ